jgi:Spy/CpxP family protein refolding chaperone
MLRKIWVGLLGLSILAVPLVYAENPGQKHFDQRTQEIYTRLNLTDDQKKQLESNKQDMRSKMTMVHREMKADREALRAELMKPQLDMSRINAIHGQIKSLLSQVQDNKLHSILTVRSILTQEQFSKFINLMHERGRTHERE